MSESGGKKGRGGGRWEVGGVMRGGRDGSRVTNATVRQSNSQ